MKKAIDFGMSSSVVYDISPDMAEYPEEDTTVDLSGVRFSISGSRRDEFHAALSRLIEEYHI